MRQLLLGFLLIAGIVVVALRWLEDPSDVQGDAEPFLAQPVMQPRELD